MLGLVAACTAAPARPMGEAERTYRAKCTSCHRAYEPASRDARGWVAAVDEMEAQKKVRLTQQERAAVLTWLTGDPRGKPGLH